MTVMRIANLAVVGAALLCSPAAGAQSLDGAYRGMFVCEQIKGSADILRVPLDLIVHGNDVRFARPLFNLQGTRVVGSEMASGTADADGKLHLTSEWVFRRIGVKGDYLGNLSANGGTLNGTQTWQGPDGISGSRTCVAALVPGPKAGEAAAQQ
jgi:hypothetical protein